MNHDNAHYSDYIKREDAIEQARRNWTGEGDWIASTEINLLKNLPSADVRENVRGEWLHDEVTMNGNTVYTPNAKCSICDCYVFQESDFCPNCGAEMRPISALSENVEIVSNLKRGELCAEKWRSTLKKIKYFKKDKAEEDNNERN